MSTNTHSIPHTYAPRLARDATVHRHCYRGTPWYLVHDAMTGRSLHLAAGAWRVVGAMDGVRSINDINAHLNQSQSTPGTSVSPDQVQVVCTELLRAGLLEGVSSNPIDAPAMRSARTPRWRQWLASPLSLRLPLVDPQNWLDRYAPTFRPLFSATAFWLWFWLIVAACAVALNHHAAFTERLDSTVISPYGVLLFLSVYVIMKLLHELAHALSIRAFGGSVSEMGVMFLVFMPVPYVDACSATTFQDKAQRMIVSSAGIMVEALISAVALLLWVNIEPGILREICFAAVVIGSVSTLLFNGNPLLRFDGYYVLSDALEIPNLATRSRTYLAYLVQRYVLRMHDARSPVVTPSERRWFVLYGMLSSIYRLFILSVIVWFVSRQVALLGYALAVWVILTQLLLPALRGIVAIVSRARAGPNSAQVLTRLSATSTVLTVLVFGLPFPAWSSAEGVIWMASDVQIKAPAEGVLEQPQLADDTSVEAGQPVFRVQNPSVVTQARIIEGELDEFRARHNVALFRDRSRLKGIEEQVRQTEERLREAQQKVSSLTVHSPAQGALHFFDYRGVTGRFVQKGDVLAYVRDGQAQVVRVVVKQTQIERLRDPATVVRVLIPGHFDRAVAATLLQELGAATQDLPSAALGSAGGGRIATDSRSDDYRTAAEDVFIVDVQLPKDAPDVAVGTRVYLRFDYSSQPLAQQMLRGLRQLTLGTTRA